MLAQTIFKIILASIFSFMSVAQAGGNPHISAITFEKLPAAKRELINERIARELYGRFRQARTSRDYENLFLSALPAKDRREVKAAYFPLKELPVVSLNRDLLTIRSGNQVVRLRFLNAFEKKVEINGKAWTYSDKISALKNMRNLEDRLRYGPRKGALFHFFVPEAEAFWGTIVAVVLPAIIIGVYNTVNGVAGEMVCQWFKEKADIDLRQWGPFCDAWFKKRDEMLRKKLGTFDSFMDLDENKELRKKYETDVIKCPPLQPGKAFTFQTRMRRSAQNPESSPAVPVPASDPLAPAENNQKQNHEDLRPWNSVAIKVRANGAPDEIILTPEGVEPLSKAAENNALSRIKFKEDGTIDKIGLRNSLYKPDDGSSPILWYNAADIATRLQDNPSSTEQEANLTSRLANVLEMVSYLKERTKECRRQVPDAPPAITVPASPAENEKAAAPKGGSQ